MTVEERKGHLMREEGGQNDRFPVGMRVLAVDDDPTCLRVLEALLLRCRYHGLHPSLNFLQHCLLHHKVVSFFSLERSSIDD